jgi:hypothetical protein
VRWRRWIYFIIAIAILLFGAVSYGFSILSVNASDPIMRHCGLTKVESGSPRFVDNDYWPVSITCRNLDGSTRTDVIFGWGSLGIYLGLAAVFGGLFVYVGRRESARSRPTAAPGR